MGGGIKEKTSSRGHPTVKIVLERCPKTEKALQELQNYHHHHHLEHCSACGGNEELIDLQNYGWTPAQGQLYKKRVLEWTLEVSASGGGRGGDSLTTHDDDDEFGWGCEGCMAQFEMLALVQRQISDLEKKEKEIVSELKKTIGNRLGVISHPNLPGTKPEVTTSLFDVDEYPSLSTPLMMDAASDEGEDFDLKPVIIIEEELLVADALHELSDDDGPGYDTIGGAGLISGEEAMNHSHQGGIVDEDQPSRNKSSRCNVQETLVIFAILRNDDEMDGNDDKNDEHSQTIESDTDPNEPNERDDRNAGEYGYLRGTEPEATSLVLDVDEDLSVPTRMMADASSDEEVDLDLKPIILEEELLVDEVENPLQPDGDDDDGLCNDTGGVDLISQEAETNHSEQGGTMGEGEDEPSPKKSRRCKARATQVISAILQDDDEIDDDDDDEIDEYSPTIESDIESDEQNESELGLHIGKQRDDRNRGGMSSNPPRLVQDGDDKHIDEMSGKVVRLSPHMEMHRSDGQTFSCETCHKTFSAKRYLSDHINCVHLKQHPHKCQKCGKGFYASKDLKRHLNNRIPCTESIKNKKIICPICKNGFSTKFYLRDHTRQIHNKETTFKCPHTKCRCRFYDETKLERHFEIHHPQDGKEISCTICNEKFSSVKDKFAHIRSNHTCKFCNKSFLNKANLDEHQTTNHAGDRPYLCTNCGNRFPRKSALRLHLRKTACNPDQDEMKEARTKAYNYKKEWLAKRKL